MSSPCHTGPMLRRWISAVLAVLCAVVCAMALAGCKIDVDVDVDTNSDGSGIVTVTAIADRAVAEAAPGLATDLRFADAVDAGWTVTPPASTPDGGLRVELSHPFATVEDATALVAGLNGPRGPLRDVVLQRTVDNGRVTITVNGSLHIDGGLDAFSDNALTDAVGATPWAAALQAAGGNPADAVAVRLRVGLPGEVASTGTAADGRVVWQAPNGGAAVDVQASSVSSASSASGSPSSSGGGATWFWSAVKWLALLALIGWLAFSAWFVGYVTVIRRRRARRRNVLMAHRARGL